MRTKEQKAVKAEKFTVTLTLGQIDALVSSAQLTIEKVQTGYVEMYGDELSDMMGALQILDEAVNL